MLKKLIDILCYYPIWSILVGKNINYDFSDEQNKHINNLTTFINSDYHDFPLDVHTFLLQNIKFLITNVQENRYNIITKNTKNFKQFDSKEETTCSFLNFHENWRGKASNDVENFDNDSKDLNNLIDNSRVSHNNTSNSSFITDEHNYSENINLLNACSDSPTISHSTPKIINEDSQAKNKKLSKYIDPCPYINDIYNKPPTKYSKMPTLINGNKFPPYKYSTKKYKLESTSLFDSQVEIFLHAIRNYSSFYKFVKSFEDTNHFLNLVYEFSQNSDMQKFYKTRFQYLYNHGVFDGDRIFFNHDFHFCFTNILNEETSLQIKTFCTDCVKEDVSLHCAISIPIDNISNKNYNDQSFHEAILKQYPCSENCKYCKNESVRLASFNINCFLAITPKLENNVIEIKEIQKHINFCDKNFFLAGIIQYIPSEVSNGQNHYVTYNRFCNDSWHIKDNKTKKSVKVLKNKKLKIALVLYIHCEEMTN